MLRRDFIKIAGSGAILGTMGTFPVNAFAAGEVHRLTILHTNDVHSRIDPFPMDGGRNAGRAGVDRRYRLIEKIRKEQENVLLVDAGDVFQGTPYFNMFHGALEMQLMAQMKYEAGVPGNHDFDKGIENLAEQLPKGKFKMVVSNYGLENTALNGMTVPRHIIQKGPLKIGIVGAGLNLHGYLTENMYSGIQFLDTIKTIDQQAAILREEGCHLIICLSHLGYSYKDDTISDMVLGRESEHVDIIIGGHTHTFLDEPTVVKNKKGKPVVINQAGWGGIVLGRLDVQFEYNFKHKCVSCKNEYVV